MNKFPIISEPVGYVRYRRTNQHFKLEQIMVLRNNTLEGWNLIPQFRDIGIRSCPQSQKNNLNVRRSES